MDKVQPSKLRLFQDLLKCAICHEIFTDPKILSCHHYFCAECIQKHHESSQEGNMAHCPICRQGFVLDLSGASNLPSCYFINDMLEKFSKEHFEEKKEKESERLCQALCLKSDKKVSALYACPPCGLDLCQDCSEAHQVFFSHHEIVDVKEYQRPAMVQALELEEESLKCNQHKEHNLSNICMDCQAALCQICKIKHKDHNCISIENIKINTLELREKLARMKDDIERKKRDIQTFKIILTTSEAKALSKLHSTHKQLHEKIDQQRTYMESQLKSYSSRLQGEITKTLDDVDTHSKSIESILELIHTLYAFGNDRCLLMYWQNIKDRSESIDVENIIQLPLESKDAIKFDATVVDAVNIGELTFSSPDTNCFGMFDTKLEEDGLHLKETLEEIYDDGNIGEEEIYDDTLEERTTETSEDIHDELNKEVEHQSGAVNVCPNVIRRRPPPIPRNTFQGELGQYGGYTNQATLDLYERSQDGGYTNQATLDLEVDCSAEPANDFPSVKGRPLPPIPKTTLPEDVYNSAEPVNVVPSGKGPPPPLIPKKTSSKETYSLPRSLSDDPPLLSRGPKQYAVKDFQEKKPQDVTTSFQCSIPVSGGAIFRNGNIALTSFDVGKVIIINSTGEKLKDFNIPRPWDAAIRNSENREILFISFLKTADKPARIDFIEWTVDRVPKTFTKDVITPYGLAFTSRNELCVCEKKYHEVRIFDTLGKIIRRICQPKFECPWYIAVTDDKFLISDFEAGCVWCLNEKGYIVDKLDKASESDPTEFHPAKCVFDGKNIFISDQDGGKVRVLSKKGQVRTVIARKNIKEDTFCPVVLLVRRNRLIVVSKHGEVTTMPVPNEDEKFRWLK